MLRHLDGLFVTNPSKSVVSFLMENDQRDDDGRPWTSETIFSKFIPKEFIHSRSILLGALSEGLTLGGRASSAGLKGGSELSEILGAVPLEAVQKILFSKHSVVLDDVLSNLSPNFCQGAADWGGKGAELITLRDKQEQFYEIEFKRYLKERADDPAFLSKFVEFCTGSNHLPSMASDDKPVGIVVEFNLVSPGPGCHPFAQTCDNTIRLPGNGLYFDDYDLFRRKMDEAIETSYNRFDAQ